MGRKRIFKCDRCLQLFSGRVAFDYHTNAHRRTDPPKRREVAPKPAKVWYDESSGNEPATVKEST